MAVLILNLYRERANAHGEGVHHGLPSGPGPNPDDAAAWLLYEGPGTSMVLFEVWRWANERRPPGEPRQTEVTDYLLDEWPQERGRGGLKQTTRTTYTLPSPWAYWKGQVMDRLRANHPWSPEARFLRAVQIEDQQGAVFLLQSIASTDGTKLYWSFDIMASMAKRCGLLDDAVGLARARSAVDPLHRLGLDHPTLQRLSFVDKYLRPVEHQTVNR